MCPGKLGFHVILLASFRGWLIWQGRKKSQNETWGKQFILNSLFSVYITNCYFISLLNRRGWNTLTLFSVAPMPAKKMICPAPRDETRLTRICDKGALISLKKNMHTKKYTISSKEWLLIDSRKHIRVEWTFYRPFLCFPQSLFQRESKSEIFAMVISSNFNMKSNTLTIDITLRLALKQRLKWIRKWPICAVMDNCLQSRIQSRWQDSMCRHGEFTDLLDMRSYLPSQSESLRNWLSYVGSLKASYANRNRFINSSVKGRDLLTMRAVISR